MSDLALSVVLGVALAAATGFRVFLPMLIASGTAYTGHLRLDDGFAWLGSPSALSGPSTDSLGSPPLSAGTFRIGRSDCERFMC
jgi:hypothetical protein